MGLGSGIRKKPVPDPGYRFKKAQDPGSATAVTKGQHTLWWSARADWGSTCPWDGAGNLAVVLLD